MIKIEGLNKKQRLLADIIWALDSQQQVELFIASLPLKERREAQTVTELMILAFLDECESVAEAQQVIKSIVDKI